MPFEYLVKPRFTTLDGWSERPLNQDEEQPLHTLVIEMAVARGMPFSWLEAAEVKRLVGGVLSTK
jgi:hypothetical protein